MANSGDEGQGLPSTELVTINAGVTVDLGLGDLISRVVGAPLAQASGILTDVLGLWRLELSIPLWRRAERKLRDAGFSVADAGPVDLSKVFPILEAGSVASDESMQDRWANLLAQAIAEPSRALLPGIADILRQLEPIDATMLDAMFRDPACHAQPGRNSPSDPVDQAWDTARFEAELGLEAGVVQLSRLDNLVRLGLGFNPTRGAVGTAVSPSRDRIGLTSLGIAFVEACQPPRRGRPEA